jgi:hypothetical protein
MSPVMYAYTLRDIGMTHRSKLNFSNGGREHPERESLADFDSGVGVAAFFQVSTVLLKYGIKSIGFRV